MDDYFPILAIVTIVIISGLSVLFLDSSTGLVTTGPGTPIRTPPISQEYICKQLEKEVKPLINQHKEKGCGQWWPLAKLICPKPVKSGYIFQIVPNQQDDPEGYMRYMECSGLISAISIKIDALEDKAGNQACKDILKNLRAPYTCPRIVVPS